MKEFKDIKECFKIILEGERAASKNASRKTHKIISMMKRPDYDYLVEMVMDSPHQYMSISEGWRQENFVMAISSTFFLADEAQHGHLFPWLFQLLQHDNGNIRYAAVRMFETCFGPMTYHIRFPDDPEQYKDYRMDNTLLKELFMSLHGLLSVYWDARYEQYEYINSLPSSQYKSIQMALVTLEDMCGEGFFDNEII